MASEPHSNVNEGNKNKKSLYQKFIEQKYPSASAHGSSGRHGSSRGSGESFSDLSHQNSNRSDSTGDKEMQGRVSSNGRVSSRKAVGDETKAHGFDYEIVWLERKLLKPEINKDQLKEIGIVGIAGVGKTRLCQEIFGRTEVKKHFLPRIWVSMARKPGEEDDDPKVAFLKRILGCLGLEKEIINDIYRSEQIAGLEYALHLGLTGKRYLIVLDDVREEDKYPERLQLWNGFPTGFGGAVIVTSRSERVGKEMVGEENLHKVLPLSDMDHCWGIYKDMVERDEKHKHMLRDSNELKAEFLRKCNGIPLVAKLMGQIKFEELEKEPLAAAAEEEERPAAAAEEEERLAAAAEEEERLAAAEEEERLAAAKEETQMQQIA